MPCCNRSSIGGSSRTRAFGRPAARRSTSPTPRSWPGSRSIGACRRLSVSASRCRWTLAARSRRRPRQVCREGFHKGPNAFVQAYGSDRLDASLLIIPLVGFFAAARPSRRRHGRSHPPTSWRDGFVERYDTSRTDDGLPPGEGAFLPCTFWYADNLAPMGRHDEAAELFDRLLGLRSDLGLSGRGVRPTAAAARRQLTRKRSRTSRW